MTTYYVGPTPFEVLEEPVELGIVCGDATVYPSTLHALGVDPDGHIVLLVPLTDEEAMISWMQPAEEADDGPVPVEWTPVSREVEVQTYAFTAPAQFCWNEAEPVQEEPTGPALGNYPAPIERRTPWPEKLARFLDDLASRARRL